jgi:hypothetical protein
MLRALLVAHHALVREGLRHLLETQSRVEVIARRLGGPPTLAMLLPFPQRRCSKNAWLVKLMGTLPDEHEVLDGCAK